MRRLAGPDGPDLRIEDLAEAVGYYSKSSFNTAFKKIAGVTPSQYRDSSSHRS
jgi:AraC-like DNA-binding protein